MEVITHVPDLASNLDRKGTYTYSTSIHNFLTSNARLYNFDPHKPHFYIVKLGLIGVISIFLAKKHRLWVLIRTASPRRF